MAKVKGKGILSELVCMYESGVETTDILEELGITKSTIDYHLKMGRLNRSLRVENRKKYYIGKTKQAKLEREKRVLDRERSRRELLHSVQVEYEHGVPTVELAIKFNKSVSTIRKYARDNGWTRRKEELVIKPEVLPIPDRRKQYKCSYCGLSSHRKLCTSCIKLHPQLNSFKRISVRARELGDSVTGEHIVNLYRIQEFKCACCGLYSDRLELGHIQSKYRNGSDEANNIVLLCSKCNVAMGTSSLWEYAFWLGGFMHTKIVTILGYLQSCGLSYADEVIHGVGDTIPTKEVYNLAIACKNFHGEDVTMLPNIVI